jgi:hypothetical protein
MSDQELRQVLQDVIDDIDTGRLVPRRGRGLRTLLVGSALAAGLALAGCGVALYGVPPVDARPDIGATDAYGIPPVDTGVDATPTTDASVDAGPTEDYGAPDVDASAEVDDGGVFLYGVPPLPEDEG